MAPRSSADRSALARSFLFRALASSLHKKAGNTLWKYIQQHPEIIGYDTNNIADYLERRTYTDLDNYVLADYTPYPGYPKDCDQETRERIMKERDQVQEMNTKATEKLQEEFAALNTTYARERAVVDLLNKGSVTDQELQKVIDVALDEPTFLMSLFRDKKPIVYRLCALCHQPGTNFDRLLDFVDYAAQDMEGNTILCAIIRAGNAGAVKRIVQKGKMHINAQNPFTGNTALMEAALQISVQPMLRCNFELMIEDLLKAGALDLPNKEGTTLLGLYARDSSPHGERVKQALVVRELKGPGCILL